MERFDNGIDTILLMDEYSKESKKLHNSLKVSNIEVIPIVIDDNGFLPDDVVSIYGYYLGNENLKSKPRYFNQIDVPDFWEIQGNAIEGTVHNINKEVAKIYYADPKHKRLVKTVDWYDKDGVTRYSNHYNKYGRLYARTIFDAKGHRVNKSFFSIDGVPVIEENYVTGDILLNYTNKTYIFKNKTEWIIHFLKATKLEKRRIFYNSLFYSFFVSESLESFGKKEDVLFWQENERDDIPGNMMVIINGNSNRTQKIVVQNKNAYNRLVDLNDNNFTFDKLGYIYDFVNDSSKKTNEVLICTKSDNIEKINEIVEALPEFKFHIAAITEMSSKLLKVGNNKNVSLYPGVEDTFLDSLFKQCDIYLDINHMNEIVDSIYRAFTNNQLILAFKETKHSSIYIEDDNIFETEKCMDLINLLKEIAQDRELYNSKINKQKIHSLAEDADSYNKLLVKGKI